MFQCCELKTEQCSDEITSVVDVCQVYKGVLSWFINGTSTALSAHGSTSLHAPLTDHSSADVKIGQTATGINNHLTRCSFSVNNVAEVYVPQLRRQLIVTQSSHTSASRVGWIINMLISDLSIHVL